MSLFSLWQRLIRIRLIMLIAFVSACSNNKKDSSSGKLVNDQIEPKAATFHVEFKIGGNNADNANPHLVFNQILDAKIDQNSNLYILDGGGDRIIKLSKQGEYLNEIGKKGKGPGEFDNPRFFDIDKNGKIYVYDESSKKISILDNQAQYLNSFIVDEPVGGMIADNTGNILLLTRELYERKGTSASLVKYSNTDGHREIEVKKFMTQKIAYKIGPPPGDLVVSTMDVDPYDNLFICFLDEYSIRKFSREEKLMSIFSREIKKLRIPEFLRQQLEKKKANLPQELRGRFKIPEYYPDEVKKLLVDVKAEKIYVVTMEGREYFKISEGIPVADKIYIDRYDLYGNLEERFKVDANGQIYDFKDVQDGKFICVTLAPDNNFSPKITCCLLNF